MRKLLAAVLLFSFAAPADEGQVKLKEGAGKDLVVGHCVICHSLDYIPMNSVFLDKKGWEATVNKMVKVMGAPVPPEDLPRIQEYLVTQYGKK